MKQYTIEQFMDTTRLGGRSFSADEKSILFHSNKTGIFNVYTMPRRGRRAEAADQFDEGKHLCRLLLSRRMRAFFTVTTRAGTRTSIFTCESWTGPSAT